MRICWNRSLAPLSLICDIRRLGLQRHSHQRSDENRQIELPYQRLSNSQRSYGRMHGPDVAITNGGEGDKAEIY